MIKTVPYNPIVLKQEDFKKEILNLWGFNMPIDHIILKHGAIVGVIAKQWDKYYIVTRHSFSCVQK